MFAKVKSKFVIAGLCFALFTLCAPYLVRAAAASRGNLIGFFYDKDGTTPLEGAVIKLKNISSGTMYESTKSDKLGVFKIESLESGIYIYGVITAQGDFNADNLVGIKIHENETAKMSVSLTPYDKDTASSMAQVYKEQEISGEALIGRLDEYSPSTEMASVYILKGSLSMQDKIHVKGVKTDFYQNVTVLKQEGIPIKRLFVGQTGFLKLKNKAEPGDLVYLVCKRGIVPLFAGPLGFASIIAGSAAVIQEDVKIIDEPIVASPYKK
jgi:hypothetical protein